MMRSLRGLPARIMAAMIGTVVVSMLTLGISVAWMARALDREAHAYTEAQAQNVRSGLLGQINVLMLDYAKWEAAVPMVQAVDLPWIYENIGASAVTGISFQLVALWGGPFEKDIGWRDDTISRVRSGLVDPDLLSDVETHLRRIPLNLYRGTEFFAWYDGSLHVIGAARIEPDAPSAIADLISRDRDTPRILMGRRLTSEAVAQTGRDYLLGDLHVVRAPPSGLHVLPLPGADGHPVAYLAWDTAHAGTNLLKRMGVPLFVVAALIVALSSVCAAFIRRGAKQLVIAEQTASVAARTDALTGLPNRAAFNQTIAAPARADERAILFLDVDDFKRINDSIGHAAGDEVIVGLAKRLAGLAGPDCFLARIAGDEFVFVLTGSNAKFRATWLSHQVERILARPFSALGQRMHITLAIGFAVQDADTTAGIDLVRQADLAMYEAKRRMDCKPVAFSAMIEATAQEATVIEQGLRRALEQGGELSVVYQPIIGLDGRMVRAEALARWTSPEFGIILPDRFIAVAEQAGLIIDLGRKLFQMTCGDLAANPALRISLNISPLQLMAPDFTDWLVSELRDRQIDPARIEIELTEAIVVDDRRLATRRLDELRRAGFSIALDDFGTGYSSIGYLREFRFNTLKIDRSFVAEIRTSQHGMAVVDGMITMALGFGLDVVCEGVETAQDFMLLKGLGCNKFQGYHFDQPLPVAILSERWLQQDQSAAA